VWGSWSDITRFRGDMTPPEIHLLHSDWERQLLAPRTGKHACRSSIPTPLTLSTVGENTGTSMHAALTSVDASITQKTNTKHPLAEFPIVSDRFMTQDDSAPQRVRRLGMGGACDQRPVYAASSAASYRLVAPPPSISQITRRTRDVVPRVELCRFTTRKKGRLAGILLLHELA
jgi:hypothetical protein